MMLKKLIKVFPLIFILTLVSGLSEQILNEQLTQALGGDTLQLIVTITLMILLSLISGIVIAGVFANYARRMQDQSSFLPTEWNDLSKESLRSIGVASMWCFAFFIPGILRFIDYLYVPFIVFLDPDYQAGKVDALKMAQNIGKRTRFKTSMVWLFFTVALPLVITSQFSAYESFFETPIQATGLSLVEAGFQFMLLYTLLKYWIRFKQRGTNGTDVQLAGN